MARIGSNSLHRPLQRMRMTSPQDKCPLFRRPDGRWAQSAGWASPLPGQKRVEGPSLKPLLRMNSRNQPVFMHPAIFISSSVLVGGLFALQEWTSMRLWNYRISFPLLLEAWGVQYFLWGVVCWLLWRWWGPQIQQASVARIITQVLPLSI